MAGSVLLALGTAVISGGTYWIVPAIIVPVVAVYFLLDRFYLKQRESPEERLAAEEDPDPA